MPSPTTVQPETDLVPDAGLGAPSAGGPAQPAATVRITSVTLLPARTRRKAGPRPAAKTPQAAARRRRKPQPAATQVLDPQVRRFGLNARERVTVPLMIGAAALAYGVPGCDMLLWAGVVIVSPCALLLAATFFVIDVARSAHARQLKGDFGADLGAWGLIGMVLSVMLMPPMSGSPVMLDLNGDGRLGTTGASTAREPADRAVSRTVSFDLAGSGTPQRLAWSDGGGDAFLVDDRDGGASQAARTTGVIDGRRLFGDEGGRWKSGYDKLSQLDSNGDGQLTGAELSGLMAWGDDNGDARIGRNELLPVLSLGVSAIAVTHKTVVNARGEALDQSSFTLNGRRGLTEDVWFGITH